MVCLIYKFYTNHNLLQLIVRLYLKKNQFAGKLNVSTKYSCE